jgi:hypothetical protein
MDAARLEVYEDAFRVMDAAVAAAAADGDLLQAKTLRHLADVEVSKVPPYPRSEPCVSVGRLADWGWVDLDVSWDGWCVKEDLDIRDW